MYVLEYHEAFAGERSQRLIAGGYSAGALQNRAQMLVKSERLAWTRKTDRFYLYRNQPGVTRETWLADDPHDPDGWFVITKL